MSARTVATARSASSPLGRSRPGILPTRLNRALSRIEDEATLGAARALALGVVGKTSQQVVMGLSLVESIEGQAMPLARTRLSIIGDTVTVGLAQNILRVADDS